MDVTDVASARERLVRWKAIDYVQISKLIELIDQHGKIVLAMPIVA